jgi:SAM-dependent methyltransferase
MSTVDTKTVHTVLVKEYRAVARDPTAFRHHLTGRALAAATGYQPDWLGTAPEPSLSLFAGVGNPFLAGPIAPGARVVDVGCGAGFDTFIAASLAGPDGEVIGVDLTAEMLTVARQAAAGAPGAPVRFLEGTAEALPVPAGWADIAISNGLLNLVPVRAAALAELARVLRPGGAVQVGDLAVERPVPASKRANPAFWKT